MSKNARQPNGILQKLAASGKDAGKPSTFYRTAHPELFSDSEKSQKPVITKAFLEFHLEQLTANKKEQEFEEFCRRLAEKQLCSNLVPQTGPTGGGDSKVDAATYPVAVDLALQRYWGGKATPTSEEWALAFSAKKDWRTKVKQDVFKIAALPRKFQRIFFITNQPARDKARAELEASLTKSSGIRVTILDRTWIVGKVLDDKLEDLAVSCLGLDSGIREELQRGPHDTAREQELNELLNRLKDPQQSSQNYYALAQDFLEAAKLATQLERPRAEVDGLFLQAQRLALKGRHKGLIIRCHYHHAWRTYFYFDDAPATEEILAKIEEYLPEVVDADEIELFSNLMSVLQTAHDMSFFRQSEEKLKARATALRHRLEAISSDLTRPNNALHAETILHLLNLRESFFNKEVAQKTFVALKKCLKRSAGLGTYPLLQFSEIWEFFGEKFCDLPEYADLQADLQRTIAHRFGETEAGKRQLHFGLQLLEKDRPHEALKQLAEARSNLMKEETLDDGVRATLACSAAYGMLGLKWTARMETLLAAHVSLNSMERFNEMPWRGFYVALRMSWRELELGRIAPFLAWRNFIHVLLNELDSRSINADAFNEELIRQDGCLSCLFVKVPAEEVADIADLDKCLEGMGLGFARIGLLFASGRRVVILGEMKEVPEFTEADLGRAMEKHREQPAFKQMPEHLCDESRTICKFQTRLFGVKYQIRCRNKIGPLLFAENLLGVLESALALAKWENLAFIVEEVNIFIDEAADGESPPKNDWEHFGVSGEQKLIWKPDLVEWMRTNVSSFREFLHQLLLRILAATTIDPLKDLERELDIWHKEKSFERALTSSPTSIGLVDLLGKDCYDLNNWINGTPTPPV
jgi:hypothetical protein